MQQQKMLQTRQKNRLFPAVFALLAFMPLNTQAAGVVLTGEIAFGGDDLAVVTSGSDLQAGQLLNLGIGYDFDLNADKSLRLRAGINYKFDNVNATNGDATFDRWPLDLILISRQGNISLGAGLTYHLSPTFEATVNGSTSRVDFNDSMGFLLQAGYMVAERIELGARVTLIEYESDSPLVMTNGAITNKVDGDSIGLYVSAGF
ncbi:hypothetical protein SCL_2727 [Sulfuricaulis limicola]|uniref:Outer membrane protein beta-barrel domain-containing protein n=1 Tax=Sulfuricaulis limicola TaxID=1620215 RepID=A0A1B4XJM9_9GAMM|nr:hypothetical protein [Sulfuricaulis limicola]BAV35004.1 hypothetical protein SCL_2727 [Sulfuricaulis limicola]